MDYILVIYLGTSLTIVLAAFFVYYLLEREKLRNLTRIAELQAQILVKEIKEEKDGM